MQPIEKLLRKHGFRIEGKNQRGSVVTCVDGKEHLGELVADYTVKKNGKQFVVVIKSGEAEIDPTDPALRRRLIEYDRVFGLDGILLVDPQEEEIREVNFKFPRERGFDFYFQFTIALLLIFGVIGIIWLLVRSGLF